MPAYLVVALLFLWPASPMSAQSVACPASGSATRSLGMSVFQGGYRLAHAQAQDGTPATLLDGLASFSIAYDGDELKAQWEKPSEFSKGGGAYEGPMHEVKTEDWCLGLARGYFLVRFSAVRDIQYTHDFLCGISGGWFCDPWDHFGLTLRTELQPGAGYPVATYRINDPSAARRLADQLYKRLDASGSYGLVSTYEVVLGGTISRGAYEPPLACNKSPCYEDGKRVDDHWYQPDSVVTYNRTLSGSVRRTSYWDPRIGLPGHTPASDVFDFATSFTSPVSFSKGDDDLSRFEDLVLDFCGSVSGCTYHPSGAVTSGHRHVTGSDEAQRWEDVCRAIDGFDCTTKENPLVPDMSEDPARAADVEKNPGIRPTNISDPDANQARSGRTSVPDAAVPSQLERLCRQIIARDSARAAAPPDSLRRGGGWMRQDSVPPLPTICLPYRSR